MNEQAITQITGTSVVARSLLNALQ